MAKSFHEKKQEKKATQVREKQLNDAQVVKMKFSEDKFYNDPKKIHFEKDKIHEVRGADQIQRWLKRGGVIVEGELKFPAHKPNVSQVAQKPEAPAPKEEVEAKEDSKDSEPKEEIKEEDKESSIEIPLDGEDE